MSVVEPKQIWWTVEELANSGLPELPGSKPGINLLAQRFGWRAIEGCAKRKVGRGGGWIYHWSVLPLAARRKLLIDASETPDERPDRGNAWAAFDSLPETTKTKAKSRLTALQMVDGLHQSGVTHVHAVAEASRQCGSSARSVYNWIGMVEGVAPEDRLAYLVPRNRLAQRMTSKAPCNPAFMDYLKSQYLQLEQPTFAQCYRDACAKAKYEGWDAPTNKTARRNLDAEVPRVTQVFAREGEGGLMRCFPAQIRDRSALTALEGVNADCHKIDVFVRWPDGTINRPQIVAFQDLYSNKMLSWRVDNDPNKVMVMAAFGELVENYGIPRHCLFDNGREFANKWMTGGAPTRFRFKVRDDDPLGVLPLMGIKIHWATPAHGQAKPIERGFRDFASSIAKDPRFKGAYTGNRPDAKPENYGSRAVPLDTFLKVVSEGIAEHNARQGRLSATARGRSFDETFAQSYAKSPIRKATEDQRRLWLMGQETGKLNKNSGQFQLYGNFYHSNWMSERAGDRVVARFDPEDLHSGIHIYTVDGSHLGYAECQQKVGFFDVTGAKEEARRKRRIKKAQKELLNAHRALSIEDIAADMDARAPDLPAQLEAKVVKPVFSKKTVSVPRHQITSDPAVLEARQAFEQRVADKKKSDPKPKAVGRFQPASTPRKRFQDAKDIIAKSDAGKRVGSGEADWLRSYIELPEYRGFQKVEEFAKRDDAG